MSKSTSAFVDALPYIDQGYDEAAREAALILIEDECKRYRPTKNYLEYLPPPRFDVFETDVMKAEFERIQSRQPMEMLNMKRYELPGPAAGKLTDLSAWNEAVDNSMAQLEHQTTRIDNLELMTEYGAEAWKSYNIVLQNMVQDLQKRLTDLRKEIQETHMERKRSQLSAGEKLKALELKWVGLVTKNYEIERAVAELERRIGRRKGEHE